MSGDGGGEHLADEVDDDVAGRGRELEQGGEGGSGTGTGTGAGGRYGSQMASSGFGLRPGVLRDAGQLTDLYLRARTVAMPWLRSPHDEASTRWWMEHVVLRGQRVRIAVRDGQICGFSALNGAWLEQLYVHPDRQRLGAGRLLVDEAKQARPGGLSLHVFTRNLVARRFYETAGFVLVDQSDGRRNEEQEPDCTYTWSPTVPHV